METKNDMRILVIDDQPIIATILKTLLNKWGFEVQIAGTGEQGVKIAGLFVPSLVLCDLTLPGMDGYAVARTLRRHPALTRTRLIAMTGYSLGPDRSELWEAGFENGLSKPFNPKDLHRILTSPPADHGQGIGA
jgi:CheY-like chemotaxis protein